MKPNRSRPMLYTPRTIALHCDLFHPPVTPDAAAIQRLHNQMFQAPEPAYTSFAVTPAGAVLSNPVAQPGANSYAAFLADRFQFREELSSLTYDDFAVRVRAISDQVSGLRNIQVFTAQHVTVRTLVNPRSFSDSRTYLKQGMFGFDDEPRAFGRDAQLYGYRMVFPPDENNSNLFMLKIESFNNDPRSLYIENQASFGQVLVAGGLEPIEQNILATYRFVVDNTLKFVGCFDAPREDASGN